MRKLSRQALLSAAVLACVGEPLCAQVTFSINETAGQSAISPYIYGLNAPLTSAENATFVRAGGNRWTAYNYENNLSNAGSDYYYENDNYLGGGSTPGGAVLPTIANAQANNAGVLLTIPINGWVAETATGPMSGVPTAAPSEPDFTPEYPTAAQDPAPAANHVYENGFIQIAENAFKSNQPLAIDLDNEPDLWSSTHAEVHPKPTTYAELLADSVAYATMIKQVDPNALVYGPVSYGWEGYLTLQNAPDSAADGDFLTWYLKNMSAASKTAGTRLLDAMDLHWYPEATGPNASGVATRITGSDTSPGVDAARLQAPRSLWDPTYVESSWITQYTTGGKGIDLIPLEESKINANYPGTKLSFSEYDYGADDSITGGVAEADVLGIFGKYGVYSANQWNSSTPTEDYVDGAIEMFRNYDGRDSTFGNTEVQAVNSDTVDTSVYASIDSSNPNHLTMVVINKEGVSVTAALNIASGGIYNSAAVYQLTASSSTPVFVGDINLSNPTAFNYSMPADSVSTISLFALPPVVTWSANGSGSWASTGNWASGAQPLQSEQTVDFTSSIQGASTVGLNGNSTVGNLYFNSSNSYTLGAGTGGTLTLNNLNAVSTITDAGGSHTISLPLVLDSNTSVNIVNPGDTLTLSGSVSGSGSLTVTGAGTLLIGSAGSLPGAANLTIGSAGTTPTVRLAAGIGVASVAGLSINPGASLDIANNALMVHFGSGTNPTQAIQSYLSSGYNGGSWSGAGIDSSTAAGSPGKFAIGYLTPADPGGTAGTVIIKTTLPGDATLDGGVGIADLLVVAQNFGQTGKDWAQGNLTYDPAGSVGSADLLLVAQNFGQSMAIAQLPGVLSLSPAWSLTTAVTPEPSCVGFVVIGAVGLLVRRRRSARLPSP